jgi:hypothetical protein
MSTYPRWRRLRSLYLGRFASAAVLLALTYGSAETEASDADAKAPVERIVLFNSGVGYFEHRGTVQGNASIELKFDVDNVNDLLKSMVLEDADGGKISAVTYGSRDPITRTLQTFAIDLTTSPTLGQLLEQIRGERVQIDAPSEIEGSIVGVEKQRRADKDVGVYELEYLTLLTDDGLRRLPLDSVGRIKLVNPQLDEEFRTALKLLADGHSADKKSVELKFVGEGERKVRVGYIQEAPVWKTSYRLVLDDEEQPFLQGWAIVENTTDADWRDVRLSLVSGRPVSFVMDLYSPLYAERPTVVPELYSSLRPQVYEQDLRRSMLQRQLGHQRASAGENRSDRASEEETFARLSKENASARPGAAAQGQGGGQAGGIGGAISDAYATPSGDDWLNVKNTSAAAVAQGADVGELFQYEIETPVTLARRTSAMLPIINGAIEGEKVSIYNARTHAKHPLNGIRAKNTSDLHLMQGPITVFDGSVYAGDARLPDMPPGAERLLSYALDLEVEVAPTSDAKPQQLASARIEKGVLTATYKHTRRQSYAVKNSGATGKTVLIEYPIENRWKLVQPVEPTEKTRDMYRFALNAEPGKSAELVIEEEQTIRQQVELINPFENNAGDAASLQVFLSSEELSESIKDALRELVKRNTELAQLHQAKGKLEREIAAIVEEQQRIRPNMQTIDRNTDLYTRYVKKLSDQEDRIEQLRAEAKSLDDQIAQAHASLNEFVNSINLL